MHILLLILASILLLFTHVQCNSLRTYRHGPFMKRSKFQGSGCVSSCDDVPNGYYHSCLGCDVYVSCSNGVTYDRRPCPWLLQWDDVMKRCEWMSSTCRYKVESKDDVCVDDCSDIPDGDYQSCTGCDVYVTCSNGVIYDKRPCPWILVWDDNLKVCDWTSSTCREDS